MQQHTAESELNSVTVAALPKRATDLSLSRDSRLSAEPGPEPWSGESRHDSGDTVDADEQRFALPALFPHCLA